MTDTQVGVVQSLRRYPVKSMLGEKLERATVVKRGFVGDRDYALIDEETHKVVSVKRPKRWGRIFELAALTSSDGVHVCFPDGRSLPIDDAALPDRLSEFFGRTVFVASSPPPDATFDEVWVRELKNGVNPYFDMPSRAEDGDEMIDGGQTMSSSGTFFNYGAIHIVTTSTTDLLGERAPETRFDPHRFRPNIVIDTRQEGFVENEWPGKTLTIGDVQLAVSMLVPRCVMTTLAQDDLPADRNVLQTITQHNSVNLGGAVFPCVGVYADTVSEGDIHTGDPVTLG